MNLREFRHQMEAVYAAYVSARQSSEDHDAVIHVAFDDGEYEPIAIAEVYLSVTDEGEPLLLLASPRAAAERAALLANGSVETPLENDLAVAREAAVRAEIAYEGFLETRPPKEGSE